MVRENQGVHLIGVKDIPTLFDRITGVWMNKIMLVSVESWNSNMIKVQT
jgi:hypothetical protein